MKSLINYIKRQWFKFEVRSLEIQIEGQTEAISRCADVIQRYQIEAARANSKRELVKARARYISLLPPGKRVTFRSA